MASKYKGSIKLPAGLSKMGGGDYKLINADDINIYSELSTQGTDKSLTTVIDDIYTTLHSKPVLGYINEPGYREGEIKYYNLGEEMFLKFSAYISAGTMNVTVYRDGVLFMSQTIESSDRIEISLGIAAKEGQSTYTISAASTLGEKSDTVLTLRQVVGSLLINSTFDSKTIRESGPHSSNNIEVPFDVIYASNVSRFVVTATLLDTNEQVIGTRTTEKVGPVSRFEGVLSFLDQRLPEAGKYTIELFAVAYLGSGATTEAQKSLYFSALTANTVAAILQDTNMEGETDSDTTLFISYSAETNIEAFKGFGALTSKCEIYRENGGSYTEIEKEFTNTSVTAGYSYSISIGRLAGGEQQLTNRKYKYRILIYNTATQEGYIKEPCEGYFEVKNTSDNTDPVSNALFTFDATNIDPIRQTNEV